MAAVAVFCTVAGRAGAQITAVPLPDPKIPGFHVPEAEATIVGWVQQMSSGTDPQSEAFNKVHLHGWGIWTALTLETDQSYEGQKLRVFETWPTPEDLMAPGAPLPAGPEAVRALVAAPRPVRSPLQKLRQFDHARTQRKKTGVTASMEGGTAAENKTVVGFVKYDPTAAAHITGQGLLRKASLDALVNGGANGVPAFPNTAFALKPVFESTSGSLVDGRYYRLAVWPGPPDTPRAFPEGPDWEAWVWVDVQGGGAGKGEVDPVGKPDGSSRTEATTYPVSSFIYFRLSAAEAQAANAARMAGNTAPPAAAGDYNILVGMHVAGREITRWTWQTFWWAPNADGPPLPSSPQIAALRPAQLTDAARHYAMALGYANKAPADPYVGEANNGDSVYAYNPYLEAGFGPTDLPDSIPGMSGGSVVANNVGVQTNCMSCHGAANYNPNSMVKAPAYSGSRHVGLDDPRFRGTLQVDFLWSLPIKAK